MTDEVTNEPIAVVPAPPAATSATQEIVAHIEAAGKAELAGLKPLIAAIVRKFVAQWEDQHATGLVGKIERHVIDSVIDSAFGPAPTS